VKGKSVTFRPKSEVRARLEEMAKSKEWTLTKIIEKAIEAFLNQLERKSG
jgi:predicted transcriptional regulator